MWNFDQALNSQQTPISLPSGRAMGVFRELFRERWQEIGRHCVYSINIDGIISVIPGSRGDTHVNLDISFIQTYLFCVGFVGIAEPIGDIETKGEYLPN